MQEAFLFVANDAWFDVAALVADHAAALYWARYPRALFTGATVYFYLAGGTKAVRYEFVVTRTHLSLASLQLPADYYNRYRTDSAAPLLTLDPSALLCELKLVRTFNDLVATSAGALKAHAGLRGRLTGKRSLSPVTARYLAVQK